MSKYKPRSFSTSDSGGTDQVFLSMWSRSFVTPSVFWEFSAEINVPCPLNPRLPPVKHTLQSLFISPNESPGDKWTPSKTPGFLRSPVPACIWPRVCVGPPPGPHPPAPPPVFTWFLKHFCVLFPDLFVPNPRCPTLPFRLPVLSLRLSPTLVGSRCRWFLDQLWAALPNAPGLPGCGDFSFIEPAGGQKKRKGGDEESLMKTLLGTCVLCLKAKAPPPEECSLFLVEAA